MGILYMHGTWNIMKKRTGQGIGYVKAVTRKKIILTGKSPVLWIENL